MHPDLVGPTCDWPRLDERSSGPDLQDVKPRFGLFALLGIDDDPSMLIGIAAKPQPANPFFSLGRALYHREIALLHLATFE